MSMDLILPQGLRTGFQEMPDQTGVSNIAKDNSVICWIKEIT